MSNPPTYTPHFGVGPRRTTPFGPARIVRGNQGFEHVVAAPLQVHIHSIRDFVNTRVPGSTDFSVPKVAIAALSKAIGGKYTDPAEKEARDAFVDALIHCPKDNTADEDANRTFVQFLKCCMTLFHSEIKPNGTEKEAELEGKNMAALLRMTFDTDNHTRNITQACLIMTAFETEKPFEILETTDRDKTNYLVSAVSNMVLKAINLIDTNGKRVNQLSVTPNGEDLVVLDQEELLLFALKKVRKMVYTMSLNGKHAWLRREGHDGINFLLQLYYDKYVPYSNINIEDRHKSGPMVQLNRMLANYVMDIIAALHNRGRDFLK